MTSDCSRFQSLRPRRRKPLWRRRRFQTLVLLAALLVILGVRLAGVESELLFQPNPAGYTDNPLADLKDRGLREHLQPVTFAAEDGTRLAGWHFPGQSDRPTILLAHGETGTMAMRGPIIKAFAERGYGVLIFDWRGYGESEGKPSESGFLQDLLAASRFLSERYGVDAGSQVALGESLAGSVVLAANRQIPFRLVILVATPTNAPAQLAARLENRGLGWLNTLPWTGLIRQRFDAAEGIRQVRSPLMIIQGRQDTDTPAAMSKTLFDRANTAAISYFVLETGGHHDLFIDHADVIFERIERFVPTQ